MGHRALNTTVELFCHKHIKHERGILDSKDSSSLCLGTLITVQMQSNELCRLYFRLNKETLKFLRTLTSQVEFSHFIKEIRRSHYESDNYRETSGVLLFNLCYSHCHSLLSWTRVHRIPQQFFCWAPLSCPVSWE